MIGEGVRGRVATVVVTWFRIVTGQDVLTDRAPIGISYVREVAGVWM